MAEEHASPDEPVRHFTCALFELVYQLLAHLCAPEFVDQLIVINTFVRGCLNFGACDNVFIRILVG